MGAGVCSSQTMKPMPEMQATAKLRRMESENHPPRCPFDRPLSKVMRNAVISPKPLQSNLRGDPEVALPRSEEHTSALQSLMRLPDAVFCLKKQNKPPLVNQ